MNLGVRFELSLRDDESGRAVAAVWGLSPALFFRALKSHLGPSTVLFGFGAGRHIERWFLPSAPDAKVEGPRGAETVTLLDHGWTSAFQSDEFIWAVCGATLDERLEKPGPAPLFSLDGLPFAHRLAFAFDAGGLFLRGKREEVEALVGQLFLARLTGDFAKLSLPVWLYAQARETGVTLFRDLVDREKRTAVLLHASGEGGVEPVSSGRGDLKTASKISWDGQKLASERIDPLPLHRRLGTNRLKLWLSDRVLLSSDDRWAAT